MPPPEPGRVLVIHGSGGGLTREDPCWHARLSTPGGCSGYAPSRFGALRSTFRPGATFDDQAHAFAALLDALHVDRVAVVALSHGRPSALLFAVLHPDRVSSLTLISAGMASSTDHARARPAARATP
ncbi:MAG: alpha/beta hydrolase [Vicinamibacterales bacterium]